MFVIKYRKIFYTLSAILIGGSIFATFNWGINFGIDFVGGSILEINYSERRTDKNIVEEKIKELELGKEFSIRPTGESGFIIRSTTISDDEKNQIMEVLRADIVVDENINSEAQAEQNILEEVRFNNVGPTLGRELQNKAALAMIIVVIAIMMFVAFAFRHVSKPVSSWKYGFVAVLTFVHDVSVPIGLFAVLGRFYGVEVDTLFVIAILVVLGYSINDTIIVFDRIRENLREVPDKKRAEQFVEIVGKSLRQTVARSINTSLTTLIALVALFFLGGDATKWFSLALIAGVLIGTYSSIFFASPMLVSLSGIKNKYK